MKSKGGLLKWVLLILLLVLVVGFFVSRAVISSYLTPEYIVSQLEENLNCRAEVKGVESHLSKRPAQIILKGVSIAEVDEELGKPLKDRPDLMVSVLQADEIVLEANLMDLLKKQITVENLNLKRFRADIKVPIEGESNLSKIFEKEEAPEEIEVSTSMETVAPVAFTNTAAAPGEPSGDTATTDPFGGTGAENTEPPLDAVEEDSEEEKTHISDLPFAGQLKRLAIENGTIYIHLEESKTTLTFDSTDFTLSDLDIDPKAFDQHNSGNLELDTHLSITKTKADSLLADLKLRGEGVITPFDPDSGNLDPGILAKLHILEGSNLDGLPMLSKLAENLSFLEKVGINVDDLDLKTDIAKDSLLDVSYRSGNITAVESAELEFMDFRLGLAQGATINPAESMHDIEYRLLMSKTISDKLLASARENLESGTIPLLTPEKFNSIVEEKLLENGRIKLPFHSHGDLRDPDVDTPLQELLSELVGGALEGLFKALEGAAEGSGDGEEGEEDNPLGNLLKELLK